MYNYQNITDRLRRHGAGIRSLIAVTLLAATPMMLTSCLGDDVETDDEWKERNEEYIATALASGEYTQLTPPWAPAAFSLVKWHNNRSLTSNNLSPLDNSICDVIYEVRDIDDTLIDSSYDATTYGDSIYRCRPSSNITGFWYLLTQMHVGDSVTAVLPAISAYGSTAYGDIKANTTMIYHVKLARIQAYLTPQ